MPLAHNTIPFLQLQNVPRSSNPGSARAERSSGRMGNKVHFRRGAGEAHGWIQPVPDVQRISEGAVYVHTVVRQRRGLQYM